MVINSGYGILGTPSRGGVTPGGIVGTSPKAGIAPGGIIGALPRFTGTPSVGGLIPGFKTSTKPSTGLPTSYILPVADRVANDYGRAPVKATDTGMPNFLDQASALITGVDFGSIAGDYESIAAKAKARIAAMYKALQGERTAATDIYQGYRDAAAQSIGSSADQAASDIAAAYTSAVQNQADEMAALGLADTLAQSASQNMAEDQGYNAAQAAKYGNAYKSANELGRAADLAYNKDMIGAAGFASAEGQAQVQQQLSSLLAQLAMAQQQSNAQLPFQRMQYAQGLQSMWQAEHPSLSASDEIALQRIAADATRSMGQRKDDMAQFFMDKMNMTPEEAKIATNDYFA